MRYISRLAAPIAEIMELHFLVYLDIVVKKYIDAGRRNTSEKYL